MTPTLYLALLTHQTGMGTVGLDEGAAPVMGRPLHLSLHTRPDEAEAALYAALCREWDEPAHGLGLGFAHTLGRSAEWSPLLLWREARAQGYTGTVTEQPVDLR